MFFTGMKQYVSKLNKSFIIGRRYISKLIEMPV